MGGVPIGPPSRSGYALRLGARIRPTALRSSLAKSKSETSLPVDIYPASREGLPLSKSMTSAGGDTKDPYHAYTTSSMTSAGGDTKDPYHAYTTSSMTSAGGQTNHSPQSEGVARTTGGTRRRPWIDPLWVGLENQRLGPNLPKDPYHTYTTSSVTSAGGQTNHSPQSEGVARTTGGYKTSPMDRPLVGRTREPTSRTQPSTRGGSHTGHTPLASVDHLLGND